MTNNIDINVINSDYSCSVELLNKDNNKSVNFSLTNPALLKRSLKLEQNILKAHNLEDKAVIETTTYSNNVILDVQAENMTLVSKDINRVAIFSNGEPVSMVTAIKVIDENNKELRYSLQPQENSVEVIIEEEMTKALVVIECAPYIDIKAEAAMYLRTFGEIDYWFNMNNSELYKVNKYNAKELVVKMTYNHISGSYVYSAPAMVSETVFYSNYKRCFFKIDGSNITKMKDDTTLFYMTHLYDNVWISYLKSGNTYEYKLIEFTDPETATYEVRDTHAVNVGRAASEYCYNPCVIFNNNDKLIVSFYSYPYSNYIPNTPCKISARINKLTKIFDFTGIDDNSILEYEDHTYNMQLKFADQKHYVNGQVVSGYHSYHTKPLTLPKNGIYEGRTVPYDCSSSEYVKIDLAKKTIIETKSSFMQKMWVNGSVGGTIQTEGKTVTSAWHVLKDTDIARRTITTLGEEAFIIPEGVENKFSINLKTRQSVFLKKEYAQNKLFILSAFYTNFNTKQSGKIVSYQVPTTENTDVEIYAEKDFSLDKKVYIISEEKDYKLFVSMSDTKRIAAQNQFNLSINENATVHDNQGDKYNLLFSEWVANNESFEGTPAINFRGNMSLASLSSKRASEGAKSLFLTTNYRETKFLEFDALSDKISLKYFPHTYKYSSELSIFIDGVRRDSITDYGYDKWEAREFALDPNKVSTIKLEYYKSYDVQTDRDNGFYIDEINCNVLKATNKATVYFKVFDFGMNVGPQGVNLLFNGLETSSNITQANFYSIDNGLNWLPFNGQLPNKDNILIKSEFTKTDDSIETFVRFNSVTVMPGEFEITTYTDTLRRIYSNHPIETVSTINHTVESVGDKYNLNFTDGDLVAEDFESDVHKIPYEFSTGRFNEGTVTLTTEDKYSGTKSCKLTWNQSNTSSSADRIPSIIINEKVGTINFKAKAESNKGGYIYLYVNDVEKYSFSMYNSFEAFKDLSYDLNLDAVSSIRIGYTGVKGAAVYIDDISFGVILPKDYSYTESEPIDLSLFPNPIKCNMQVNDLQSTSELNTTHFYSVDNGEWQQFVDTLPNLANVRVKTVFTKAFVDEVVTSSFKSISIIQESSSEIKVNLQLNTVRIIQKSSTVLAEGFRVITKNTEVIANSLRRVIKTRDIPFVPIIREVTKDLIVKLDNKRNVIKNTLSRKYSFRIVHTSINKKMDSVRGIIQRLETGFATTRQVIRSNKITIRAATKRTVNNSNKLLAETIRIAHKKSLDEICCLRKISKNNNKIYDTKRTIVKLAREILKLDTVRRIFKRTVKDIYIIRLIAVNKMCEYAVHRKAIANKITRFDTLRMVEAEFKVNKELDTIRILYKAGSPFVTQLNITYKLEKGLLRLESQQFN